MGRLTAEAGDILDWVIVDRGMGSDIVDRQQVAQGRAMRRRDRE